MNLDVRTLSCHQSSTENMDEIQETKHNEWNPGFTEISGQNPFDFGGVRIANAPLCSVFPLTHLSVMLPLPLQILTAASTFPEYPAVGNCWLSQPSPKGWELQYCFGDSICQAALLQGLWRIRIPTAKGKEECAVRSQLLLHWETWMLIKSKWNGLTLSLLHPHSLCKEGKSSACNIVWFAHSP